MVAEATADTSTIISIARDSLGSARNLVFVDESASIEPVFKERQELQDGVRVELLEGPPLTQAISKFRPPLFSEKNHPAHTRNVRRLMPQLWAIVLSKALQSGVKAEAAIDAETERETGDLTAILRVYLQANAAQAIAFWNGLDPNLDTWMASLSASDKKTAQSDIALRVHWTR